MPNFITISNLVKDLGLPITIIIFGMWFLAWFLKNCRWSFSISHNPKKGTYIKESNDSGDNSSNDSDSNEHDGKENV